MHVEQSSAAYQAFQMNKAFQEIDNRHSEIGNQMTDFRIVGELGRGSYGTVYKVQSLKNNQTVVLKKISLKHMKPKQQQAALKEVQILKFLDHPHIIKYFTSFMEDESIHIVMEYAEKGDLYKLLKEQRTRRKYFSEKDIWDFSYQICMAVEYLHLKNIIHRDIKCLNVFLTDDKRIKIGDLGVSKIVSSAVALQDTRVGTPLYLSPELVKQQPYDFKVDIWAVGCAIYHLACLEPPFQGDNLITLGNNIVNKKHKALPQIYSNKLSNFIDKFLAKKSSDRPTAREAVQIIPSFVKSAYSDNMQRRNIISSLQSQESQQSQQDQSNKLNTSPDKVAKSVQPTKDFKLPRRRQIEEQGLPIKKPSIETQNIKVENNIPFIQLQKLKTSESGLDRQSKLSKDQGNQSSSSSNQNNKDRIVQSKFASSDLLIAFKNENKGSEHTQEQKGESKNQIPTLLNSGTNLNIIKSQSQERIQTQKLQTQISKQPRNSQLNFNNQEWPLRQNIKLQSLEIEQRDHRLPLKNVNSQKFTSKNQISSQVALQSTNEETQKGQSRGGSGVNQLKSDNQIIQSSDGDEILSGQIFHHQKRQQNEEIQQADRGIFKGEVDLVQQQNHQLKQQRLLQQLGKEMPYIARPQTASASNNNFIRRTASQQQSSQASISVKPGISLLRNIAQKQSQENLIEQIQQQNYVSRPFSAAVPQIQGINQGRKKNVMFEDDIRDEQSELEIINDDDGNDNDYVQFNSNKAASKIQKISSQAPPMFKNQIQNIQLAGIQNQRPTTAVNQRPRATSIQVHNLMGNFHSRQSFDSNQHNKISIDFKDKGIVTSSIDNNNSGNNKDKISSAKNQLNSQSSQDYENQVSKFFKNNMKRQPCNPSTSNGFSSQISISSHQSQIINSNDLKEHIKNYQPSSAQSLISHQKQLENDNKLHNLFKSIDRSSNADLQNKNLALQQQKLVSLVQLNQPPLTSNNKNNSNSENSDKNIGKTSGNNMGSPNYIPNLQQIHHNQQDRAFQSMAEIQNRKYQQQNRLRLQKKITIRDLEKPAIQQPQNIQQSNLVV